jgi:hypothetical protein
MMRLQLSGYKCALLLLVGSSVCCVEEYSLHILLCLLLVVTDEELLKTAADWQALLWNAASLLCMAQRRTGEVQGSMVVS